MTLYKMAQDIYAVLEQEENASRQRLRQWRPRLRTVEK